MKARALPLAVACVLAITSRTAGQDVDLERESLAGLDGLFVLVEYLGDEEQEGGLTEDALHTYSEMRLKQARIPVLSEDEWSASERRSYLYLNVHGLRVVGVQEPAHPLQLVAGEVHATGGGLRTPPFPDD